MAPRIFFKLILALILVLGIALFAVDFFSAQAIEASYIAEVRQSLSEKVQLLAHTSERVLIRDCVSLAHAADSRLTLVAPGGTVLADSQADP